MSINVTWGNAEKTYTIFTYEGRWTWDEYYASIAQGYSMVKDIPYTVNIVLDMSNANLLPHNVLSHANSSMKQPPRDFDLAVIVSQSGFVNTIGQILDRLFGKKTQFKIVKTLNEALALIQEHDAKRADLPRANA